MKAVQYRTIGQAPEVVEIPTPEPGPGQVRLKVTAAGLCHSDSFVMSLPQEQYTYGLPLTLGHEGAGIVDAVGEGVSAVQPGESFAVYGPWGCGLCRACAAGAENYCEVAVERGILPPGLGSPGAMAEYMIVDDVRHLVPLGDLDPVQNVALTDAGLTPYHAIKPSVPKLVPGSYAVVIGSGGLGHIAIQILRALTDAQIIVLDIADDKLALAKDVGAHHVAKSDEKAPDVVREITGGRMATAVFDFVSAPATAEIAAKMVHHMSDIVMVGVGPGAVPVGFFTLPYEVSVRSPYWGPRPELFEVLELARSGAVHVEVERFSIDDAPLAYQKLHNGELRGRAVVVP